MSSQQIWALKKRLDSINNISEITKAMSLVSSIKLKQFQKIISNITEYHCLLNKQLVYLLNDYKFINDSIFIKKYRKKENNKEAYIIFTSNVGLCGAYNDNLLKELKNSIYKDKIDKDLYVYGKYGNEKIKKLNLKIYKNIFSNSLDLTYNDLYNKLTKEVINKYCERKYSSIKVIYTDYNNGKIQEVKCKELLPFKLTEEFNYIHTSPYIMYEYNPNEIFDFIVKKITRDLVYIYYLNSRISEEFSRYNSMYLANENGKKLGKQLQYEFNKNRQGKITQDMNEIISSNL